MLLYRRYAPKCNELSGQYVWYHAADIYDHTALDKQSRKKQMAGARMTDIAGTLSIYEQQQQIITMQQYQNEQNNLKSDDGNGMVAKLGSPLSAFNKLKTFCKHKLSKEAKTKKTGQKEYFDELEEAKRASLALQMRMEAKRVNSDGMREQSLPIEADLLDLMSMTLPVDDDKNEIIEDDEKQIVLDENDPFYSLVVEYKNDQIPKVIPSDNNADLLDFDQIESSECLNDFHSHSNAENPSESFSDANFGKQGAQNMAGDLWRILELSLMET